MTGQSSLLTMHSYITTIISKCVCMVRLPLSSLAVMNCDTRGRYDAEVVPTSRFTRLMEALRSRSVGRDQGGKVPGNSKCADRKP